ncbi:hypothetical protein ScalyP_jg2618 [Parmales sp. scaly parma]|nr:hypothetical protein ScalyP_jg2618 [Parmales sp. scaly parma]
MGPVKHFFPSYQPFLALLKAAKATTSTTSTSFVSLETLPTHSTITISDASSKNALNPPMMLQLADHVSTLVSTPTPLLPCLLIITGNHSTFCAGANIKAAKSSLMTREAGVLMSKLMTEVMNAVSSLPLVSIAAIEGSAYGGGAELATCCDFRVLANGARMKFVQGQMGVSTGWGGGKRLAKIVGEREALKVLLSRQAIDGELGKKLKLVDHEGVASSASSLALRYAKKLNLHGTAPEVVFALKAAASSQSEDEETEAFAKVWGGAAHRLAFSNALKT